MINDQVTLMRMAMRFFEAGIAPLGMSHVASATSIPAWYDINRVLAEMPPEDARRMRRKFRKMWRRVAAAAAQRSGRNNRKLANELGYHIGGKPTRRMKEKRKNQVIIDTRKKIRAEDAV